MSDDMKKDVLTYEIDGNLYVNMTNRCSNNCEFCVRNHMDTYEGYDLWLEREHSAEEFIEELKRDDLNKYKEIVFCGYGEPMYRYDAIKKIADYVHSRGAKTRINTNGQANEILGYDATVDIKNYIDMINVSLNSSNRDKYDAECHSIYGKDAFEMLLDFAKRCQANGANVILSIVDCIGEDEINACKKLARELGLPLRVREML